jgi:hypothetical protein
LEELELNEITRSDRKWAWTNRNLARADDIRSAMDELRRWWPMTASPGKRKQSVIRFKKQSILSFIERHARGV